MKSIYFTLISLGMFMVNAFAQKDIDLQIKWITPMSDGTYANLNNGDTLWTRLQVKNAGVDSVTASDTTYFRMSGELLGLTNEVGVTYNGTFTMYPGETDTLNIYAIKGTATGQFDIPTNITFDTLYAYIVAKSGVWHNDPGVTVSGTQATVGGDNLTAIGNVTFGNPNGIGNINGLQKTALQVYPNPTRGNLSFKYNFENTTATARVTDLTGRVVLQKEYGKLSGEKELSLDASVLTSGMYYLELVTDDKRAISKFTMLQH